MYVKASVSFTGVKSMRTRWYVCMHICMYVCMYVCIFLHKFSKELFTGVKSMRTRWYVCIFACVYACMHVCMYVCMQFSKEFYIHTHLCISACQCAHTYTEIYTYTPLSLQLAGAIRIPGIKKIHTFAEMYVKICVSVLGLYILIFCSTLGFSDIMKAMLLVKA
jgi:hypothetical protein